MNENLQSRNPDPTAAEARRDLPAPLPPAATAFESALRFNVAPARASAQPPEYEAISAIDFVVKVLTGETDGVKPFSGHWTEVFLQALARAPIVTVAARIAGVSRNRATEERLANPEFARRWDDATEEGLDEIEAAAYRSAVYGDEKPVFYQGEQIGRKVDYSHAASATLLKARRSAIFGKEKDEPQAHEMEPMTLDEFEKRLEEAARD